MIQISAHKDITIHLGVRIHGRLQSHHNISNCNITSTLPVFPMFGYRVLEYFSILEFGCDLFIVMKFKVEVTTKNVRQFVNSMVNGLKKLKAYC